MTNRRVNTALKLACVTALAGTAAIGISPEKAAAQDQDAYTVYDACYIPQTGVIYLIKAPGRPEECRSSNHVEFSFTFTDGQSLGTTDGGPPALYVDEDGSIGIGTTSPSAALDVVGDVHASGELSLGNSLHFDPVDNIIFTGPNEALEISAESGVVMTGTWGAGAIPASGQGTRLMWYPAKAAFRVGYVWGDEWNQTNIGARSTAMGEGPTASGEASTAMGHETTASRKGSTAMGVHSRASGSASTAMGYYTKAEASSSTAMGSWTTASGDYSTAMGHGTTASGTGSTAMGVQSRASGWHSTAMGSHTTASAQHSTAMGRETTASGYYSTAMGSDTEASGIYSTAMGAWTTASGDYSTAMGRETEASGDYSTALGRRARTLGHEGSFVYGDGTDSWVSATGENQFVVQAAGGTYFYSNSDLTAGVILSPGAGIWSAVSDVNRKENFRSEDSEEVLARIAAMEVPTWNYKAQDPSIRHVGPTAQDFYAAFGLGESDTTITTLDISGINMLAIQALERRTRELQDQLALRDQEVGQLRGELAALLHRVERLEATARR